MARTEGICQCSNEGCKCINRKESLWVDKITGKCRRCEVDHGERWGHHDIRVQEASQSPGEHTS